MNSTVTTPPTIRAAEWDSSFFGMRIGRLIPDADSRTDLSSVRALDRSRFDCVWIDLDVAAGDLLKSWAELGAHPVDVRVELATGLREIAPAASPVELVTRWSEADRESVTALAVEQSSWSRLARDPAFAPSVPGMYRSWVTKVFAGEHEALAWRDAGRIVGMLTMKTERGIAWIELFDVVSTHRGRGIGGALVAEFLRRASASGSREARVRTQLRNLPAIRTYERAGFTIDHAAFVLHWWSAP